MSFNVDPTKPQTPTQQPQPNSAGGHSIVSARLKMDSIFSSASLQAKRDADTDGDGHISFDEAKAYINNANSDGNIDTSESSVIRKLAAVLGIEVKQKFKGVISENPEVIQGINQKLDILKRADKNGDLEISLDEINNEELSVHDKTSLNRIFGLVDGKFNNRQGAIGNCYQLVGAQGIATVAPELYEKVVQRTEDGNAIVTLYGAEGEPFQCTIPQNLIQRRQEAATMGQLQYMSGMNIKPDSFGSTDPDAIALEIATEVYMKQSQSRMENKVKDHYGEYLANSTCPPVEKFDISKLSFENLEDNHADFRHLKAYIQFSTSPTMKKPEFRSAYDFKNNPELIEECKKYIANSEPIDNPQPSVQDFINNSVVLRYWHEHSRSDTVEKPPLIHIQRTDTTLSSGYVHDAIKLAVGGGAGVRTKEADIRDEIKNFATINSNGNKQVYSASFESKDAYVIPKHAYLVKNVTEDSVILVNPHDSTKTIRYPKKDFFSNCRNLDINRLPLELPDVT